jgi:hypothetical protein
VGPTLLSPASLPKLNRTRARSQVRWQRPSPACGGFSPPRLHHAFPPRLHRAFPRAAPLHCAIPRAVERFPSTAPPPRLPRAAPLRRSRISDVAGHTGRRISAAAGRTTGGSRPPRCAPAGGLYAGELTARGKARWSRGGAAARFRFGGEKRKVWTGPTCEVLGPHGRAFDERNAAMR